MQDALPRAIEFRAMNKSGAPCPMIKLLWAFIFNCRLGRDANAAPASTKLIPPCLAGWAVRRDIGSVRPLELGRCLAWPSLCSAKPKPELGVGSFLVWRIFSSVKSYWGLVVYRWLSRINEIGAPLDKTLASRRCTGALHRERVHIKRIINRLP